MTKKHLLKASLLLAMTLSPLTSSLSYAQSSARYISDVIYVPLRAGMGNNYEVVKPALTSGTKLTLIREATDDRGDTWALLTTAEGEQGWMRSQHLVTEPTASIKLAQVTSQLSRASNSVKDAAAREEKLSQLQTEHEQLQKDYQALVESSENLRQVSTTALDLETKNQTMHETNQLLQTRVDVLQAENEQLRQSDRYNQWFYGAGIMICGVILSLLLQSIGKRKRQSEWR